MAATVWAHTPLWRTDQTLAVAYSLIGLSWLGVAWMLWREPDQRANARFFLVLGALWLLGESTRRGVPLLFDIGLIAAQFTQIPCAAILLRYPAPAFDRAGRIFLASGLAVSGALAVPLVLLAPRPNGAMLATLSLGGTTGTFTFDDVQYVRSFFWLVYGLVFLTLFVRRWRRLTRFERRIMAPIFLVVISMTVTVGGTALEPILPDALVRLGMLGRAVAGVGVSVAFIDSARRLILVRSSVADLLGRLSGEATLESVEQALVQVFAEPSIAVVPPGDGAVVAPERIHLPVLDGAGHRIAVASFPRGFAQYSALLTAHLAACGLVLDRALTSRAAERARTGLIQATLKERRRLERDLHDGAQQRLLSVGLRLGALEAQAGTPRAAHALRLLREELHEAHRELRELAHGIYPEVLIRAGLRPALQAVVDRLPVPCHLVVPDRRWPEETEIAMYLIACEATANIVKHAGPCRARIVVGERDRHLELLVEDDGIGIGVDVAGSSERPLLATVRDRLTDLGGAVEIGTVPGGGTSVRVRVPLGESRPPTSSTGMPAACSDAPT